VSPSMTLKAKLEALWDNAQRTRHPGLTQAYKALIRNLSAIDMTAQSLKAGDPMPHFLLPNVDSRLVNSRELLERGPLVVSFFRGEWCPFCTLELQALRKKQVEIEKLGATLVAVTPDTGAALRAAKEKYRLPLRC
jgi:alkyl hydroperoxide reductase subunit AhpC